MTEHDLSYALEDMGSMKLFSSVEANPKDRLLGAWAKVLHTVIRLSKHQYGLSIHGRAMRHHEAHISCLTS